MEFARHIHNSDFTPVSLFYIVRVPAGVELGKLWRVLSQPIADQNDAAFWCEHAASQQDGVGHNAVLLQMVFHPDYPSAPPRASKRKRAAGALFNAYFVVRSHANQPNTWKVLSPGLEKYSAARAHQEVESLLVENRQFTVMVVQRVGGEPA